MNPWLTALVEQAHQRLLQLRTDHDVHVYLRSRGVREPDLRQYKIGWLDNPSEIQRCTPDFWEWVTKKAGWQRIWFPFTDPFGQVTGLQARSVKDKSYSDFIATPKEIVPPCFGLHVGLPAAFRTKRLVITEGVFDYFAVRPYAEDSLAILTSAASLALRQLFTRYVARVIALLDMDPPGRRGAYRLAGLPVPEEYRDPRVAEPRLKTPPYQVVIPAYSAHDPNDLYKEGKHDELRRLAALGTLARSALPVV